MLRADRQVAGTAVSAGGWHPMGARAMMLSATSGGADSGPPTADELEGLYLALG